jgi:CBS domain-containing protein
VKKDLESVRQIPISNLVSTPLTVNDLTPISKVVGLLKKEDAYEVFTQSAGRIGMVMIRDILRSSEVTSEKVESLALDAPRLPPRAPLAEAARLMMRNRLRAIPVVEGDKLLGSVAATSIISALPAEVMDKYHAQDIMTPNPASLSGSDEIAKARNLMLRRKIDHIPVAENGKLSGMLTSSQIVFNVYQETDGVPSGPKTMVADSQRRFDIPVKGIMDTDPLTSPPSARIADVLKRMLDRRATYCLITQFDEIQGIVTYRDFMKLIVEEVVKSDVPVYVVGLPDDPFEAEQTRTKFIRSVENLRRTVPYIEEARAVIRTREGAERERRRYEVTVHLVTPKRNYSYSSMGFELANIFDDVSNHLKTMMAERPKRSRESPRHRENPP